MTTGISRDPHLCALARAYLLAKQRVIASGYEDEIGWQETVTLDDVTASTFMREAAWVVLCAGMREAVVRARFKELGRAFAQWDPGQIAQNGGRCRRLARKIFNHSAKLKAIVGIAVEVENVGVERMIHSIQNQGPVYLTRLPYIGPVTCFHLAKNLGCPVAKPDRHLERMAAALGYQGASRLCSAISTVLDEPIQVVDLVMWRFATIDRDYVAWILNSTAHAPRRPRHSNPTAPVEECRQ